MLTRTAAGESPVGFRRPDGQIQVAGPCQSRHRTVASSLGGRLPKSVGYCGDQGAYDFARVLSGGPEQETGQVDRRRFAFLHAVGVQHETITGAQVDVLYLVATLWSEAEGHVDGQRHFLELCRCAAEVARGGQH
ncbi:hypothetical protein SMICM304S_11000 [Streptomyces microflavus]